jgi:putative tryptophan/tyrosine transport system substrate-binding protein
VNLREFITLLGGAAAWPVAARAQQPERFRRVAALMLYTETDPAGQVRASIFRQTLEKLGWTTGRNLHIDFHWGIGDGNWIRTAAANLIKLMPDVFLANGGQALEPVRQTTSTVPIIFIGGSDPVADGIVRSLANPAGNITGFTVLEPSVGAKLLGLLKEIAPGVTRATILVSPGNVGAARLATSAQSVGTQFATNVSTVSISDANDIELFFNTQSNGSTVGLIVPPDPFINTHRKRIVELAAQRRVPAIYALRSATVEGGLMSYGVDLPDLFRQAAGYTDRILRGERPGDLPVQQPSKFEMIINLRTAKLLGLTVSDKLLVAADEVIE